MSGDFRGFKDPVEVRVEHVNQKNSVPTRWRLICHYDVEYFNFADLTIWMHIHAQMISFVHLLNVILYNICCKAFIIFETKFNLFAPTYISISKTRKGTLWPLFNILGLKGVTASILFENHLPMNDWPYSKRFTSRSLKKCLTFKKVFGRDSVCKGPPL